VIVEVALAVVLVIGCGLMIKSFARVQQVDVGFNPDGLVTMQLDLPRRTYPDDNQINAFWDRLLVELRAIPGVASASIMSACSIPPGHANDMYFEARRSGATAPTASPIPISGTSSTTSTSPP